MVLDRRQCNYVIGQAFFRIFIASCCVHHGEQA